MSRLAKFGYIDARRTVNPVRPRKRSRGIPTALEGHEIFYTEDLYEASTLIGQALSPNRLTLDEFDSVRFAAGLHGVRLRDVCMMHLDLHVAATLVMDCTGPYYAVHMPMNSQAVCVENGYEFVANTTRAAVTSPGQNVTMRFDHDSPQLIIRIEQEALVRHVTRLLGRRLVRPLVFEPEMDKQIGATALLWSLLDGVTNLLNFHPHAAPQPAHESRIGKKHVSWLTKLASHGHH